MNYEYIVELKCDDDYDSIDGFTSSDEAGKYAREKMLTGKWTEAALYYKEKQRVFTRKVKESARFI